VTPTPRPFCTPAHAIVHSGATPICAAGDPRTGNRAPAAAEAAITPRTRALRPVHSAGRPADVAGFRALAERYGLPLIEDAAHCIEGVSGGRKIGTTADFTSFSFYATKNLTTGEGGMVTTASADAAERIRIASSHGLTRQAWSRYLQPGPAHYELVMPGFKYNMSDLQAAIGLHQLAAIQERYERRLAICEMYDAGLADLPVRRFDPVPPDDRHARHLYTIQIDPAGTRTRDDVSRRMADAGVATSVHFPAVHLHRDYAERFGFTRGWVPQAERLSDTVLSLPLSSALSDAQITRVIDATRRALGVV
jgi:dTDP-4-amino-4,6-dideoxygalactose transaminase